MERKITVHHNKKYVEVVTSGVADKENTEEMAKVIAETMKQNKFVKALIDHSNITSVSGTVIEIYQRPILFKVIGVFLGIKIAEVIRPEHEEHFRFFETVCLNRGFKFKMFHERTNALRWLLEEEI